MCCCLLCFVYVCFVMCGGFCCFVCFVCVCLFPPPFGFHRALAYGSLNKFARSLNLPPRGLMYIFVNLLSMEIRSASLPPRALIAPPGASGAIL